MNSIITQSSKFLDVVRNYGINSAVVKDIYSLASKHLDFLYDKTKIFNSLNEYQNNYNDCEDLEQVIIDIKEKWDYLSDGEKLSLGLGILYANSKDNLTSTIVFSILTLKIIYKKI